MNWKDIVRQFAKINTVRQIQNEIVVNGKTFIYKHKEVAREIAKKIEMFKGI